MRIFKTSEINAGIAHKASERPLKAIFRQAHFEANRFHLLREATNLLPLRGQPVLALAGSLVKKGWVCVD